MTDSSLSGLLATLRDRGISIAVNEGSLRVEAPKGAMTAALQTEIRAYKSELLALLDPASGQDDPGPDLVKHEGLESAPLSHAQEGIWLHQRVDPDSTAFNILARLRIRGRLDIARLQAAMRQVMERHTPLRSVVVEESGEPRLRLAEVPDEPIRIVGEEESEIAYRPFDLAEDLPIRVLVRQRALETYELTTVVHHIAVDGTSIKLLLRDLLYRYEGLELPELPIAYGDYAVWDRERWSNERLADGVASWVDDLRGAPTALDIPTDRGRPAIQTFSSGSTSTRIVGRPYHCMTSLIREERATPFMALLAAYGMALHRQSGDRDFVIGTPVSGRSHPYLRDLVGMFVNQIPLRVEIEPEDTFRSLLRRCRLEAVRGFDRQDVPFAKIVQGLELPRDPSRAPLYQAFLNVVPFQSRDFESFDGELRYEVPDEHAMLDTFDGQVRYEFTVYGRHVEDGIDLDVLFNRDLFGQRRVDMLLADMVRFFDEGSRAPDRAIAEYMFPSEPEVTLDARRPSGAETDASDETTILGCVRASADRNPDGVALVARDRDYRYRELVDEADRIAAVVADPGSTAPVGVLARHVDDAIPAILGVMGSGRPYVPLDPGFPISRLRFMAEDSGLASVLVSSRLASDDLPWLPDNVRRIDLGNLPVVDAHASVSPAPTDPAYLMYTSGSSGQPKAIVQSHANAAAQILRYVHALELDASDRLALTASISFDASLMDLFGGLFAGAAVYPHDLLEMGSETLSDSIRDAGLTVLHFTPSVLRLVAPELSTEALHSVRMLVLGGETATGRDVRTFDELFPPSARMLNLYGASEHSFSFGYLVDREQDRDRPIIPIGFPMGDVHPELREPTGNVGATKGQLVIRSRRNALRYHRRPEQTEQVFGSTSSGRAKGSYATGDQVRRGLDGELLVLGRIDHQIKVRGIRIEPGEIETTLLEHPRIAEVGVHSTEGSSGGAILTACVVSNDSEATSSDWVDWCRERLPEFMIPTAWVRLDALPRTPTGKLDRKSLPSGHAGDGRRVEKERPKDEFERRVVEIWEQVLGVGDIGTSESFFELGGHSLLAVRMAARIRDRFGVELPLRRLFDRPTVAETAEWIRTRNSSIVLPPIERREFPDGAPLSFSQERMWFLQALSPQETAYNMAGGAELLGPLDIARYERALNRVLERHEVLRSVFPLEEAGPVQRLRSDSRIRIHRIDPGEGTDRDRFAHARMEISEWLGRPYDIERDLLVRVAVAQLGPERHLVGLGMHHIVGDLVSFMVIGDEVAAHYAIEDGGPELPDLPVQYSDFSAWQRGWFDGGYLDDQLEYWLRKVAGAPALEMPTDFPRPAFVSAKGGSTSGSLAPSAQTRLRQLATDSNATAFMVSLAGFNALLHALTGQDDISIGCPVAHRTLTELEPLAGTFVNTLVHRNDLSGDPTFRDLVDRVRANALVAFEHQDLPFELLVRESNPERDTSRAPLVQVLFNYGTLETRYPDVRDVAAKVVPLQRQASQFDLSLNVLAEGEEFGVHLTFAQDLLTSATAQRILERYIAILERGVSNPDLRISELTRVLDSERTLLLDSWNRTQRALEPWVSVPETVTRVAESEPDRIAAEDRVGTMSYGEMLDHARRVSAALTEMGVRPGDRVAVLLPRDRTLPATLLGVLGAGAAYVPVDPGYPEARIRYVLEDSGATALLHRGTRGFDLPTELRTLDLDGWVPPSPVDFVSVEPEHTAYVIYTSGSTGKPKGVVIPHGAMANFLRSMGGEPGIDRDDVLVAVTTISFDISVLELFLPLTVGARVVVASEEEAADPIVLADRLEEVGATVMQATPATWKALVATEWRGRSELKAFCGGEALPEPLKESLVPKVAELWNLYGPTETTVWSSVARMEAGDPVTIGHPIENTRVYILDENRELTPIGVPGELYIGGEGVATGYLGRDDLTDERFGPDPFRPGERMYRTGDRARWRYDGRLEHLGRLDFQVKVRGFRIELGEVESALLAHPGVREAAAVARDERLIGYVAPDDPSDPISDSDLRTWVGKTLPGYMVPSIVVSMDALPRTPNQKIDRRALPDPEFEPDEARFVPTSGLIEDAIAEIWRECLEVDRVGANDDFFRLGGHSLVATRVASRMGRALEIAVPLRTLFEHTTVRGLATWVETARGRGAADSDPSPSHAAESDAADQGPVFRLPVGSSAYGPVPISPAQRRIWMFQEFDPESSVYNLTAAVRIDGPLDADRLDRVLRAIIRDHEPLRTRLVKEGSEIQLHVDTVPETVLERVDAGGRTLDDHLAKERSRPFRLAHEHPFRALLVRDADEVHHLVLTVHHVAVDGTGQMRLFGEILDWLERTDGEVDSMSDGESAPTYSDYAASEHRRWAGPDAEREVRFWRDHLSGAPEFLNLPTDRTRTPLPTYSGGSVRGRIEEDTLSRLRIFAGSRGCSPFMILLGALSAALHRMSGERNVVIGTPVDGRRLEETERMVGMFVNPIPIHVEVDPGANFGELVDRARETSLDAMAHGEFPFATLLEHLDPTRDVRRTPVFQVMLNVLPPYTGELRKTVGDLTFSIPDVHETSDGFDAQSKFDLTLYARDRGDTIELDLAYNRDLFDPERMDAVLEDVLQVVRRGVNDPTERVFAIPEAPARFDPERVPDDRVVEGTVLERIRSVVESSPEGIALSLPEADLSYFELWSAACEIAHALHEADSEPKPVGVFVGHRAEAAVAILGVLLAGRPYVPLDPEYPEARLRFMVEDSELSTILCRPERLESAREIFGSDVTFLAPEPDVAATGARPPEPLASGDEPAYLLYTSGSTGQPKAVRQTHRTLLRQVMRYIGALQLGPTDRLGLFASISFDASLMDLFGGWVAGATVAPVDLRTTDLASLPNGIEERGITVVHWTPSVFRALARSAPVASYPTVRAVVLGGEPVRSENVAYFDRRFEVDAELLNLYGSSEHSFAVGAFLDRRRHRKASDIPIGLPLGDIDVELLDENGRPTPVEGELVLSSRANVPGYWKRPELDRRVFRPTPDPEVSKYHTGDRVRRASDGSLFFVGRVDHQLKVRGIRIEAQEVESILNTHPDVSNSAVHTVTDDQEAAVLVACVVLREDATWDRTDLVHWCRDRLPSYTVPTGWVRVDALPRTPSGKLDRTRLPMPDRSREVEDSEELPQREEHCLLAEVWEAVLGIEGVLLSDNFFEIGGQSLSAIEVVEQVERRTGKRLDPRSLFFKTLRELGDTVREGRSEGRPEMALESGEGRA